MEKLGKQTIKFNNPEVGAIDSNDKSTILKTRAVSKSITITPPPSSNANLSSLSVSNGSINFNKDTTNSKVNINTATIEELTTLNGIGESKAKLIIEYRTKKPFEKIEDIMNVSGIGESAYEKIKNFITV